jgi:uncharacterized DUF497 family protein
MVTKDYGSFSWDERKDIENLKNHGVSFMDVCQAFADPHRVITVDEVHSKDEQRYFCIGKVGTKVATVRFTYRNDKIRIIGAGFWRKGKKIYEAK